MGRDPVLRKSCKSNLLVMVGTFSGWVEDFLTKRETDSQVAKKILEIVPQFGLPEAIGSDIGSAFANSISQEMARAIGTN